MTMTMRVAQRHGWTIERGAYYGTTDDRADRWYAYRLGTYGAIDRRGSGYATRREALEAVQDWLDTLLADTLD